MFEGAELSPDMYVHTRDVELERLRSRVSRSLSGHALASLNFKEYRRESLFCLVQELETEVLSEKLEEREKTVTFCYPKNWWEMFKKQYFRGWLIKRFPVREETATKKVIFKKYATYPHLPEVRSDCGPIIYKSIIYEKN